jgi:hypothetical protein
MENDPITLGGNHLAFDTLKWTGEWVISLSKATIQSEPDDGDPIVVTKKDVKNMLEMMARFTQLEREFKAIKEHLSKRSTDVAEFEALCHS